jgi:PAS domain S-box-containing protein
MSMPVEQQLSEDFSLIKEQYDAILTSLQEAIITSDQDGVIINCNNSAQLMFGYSYNELIGYNVSMVIPDKYKTRHTASMNNLKCGGSPTILGVTRELEGLRKSGDIFPIEICITRCQTKRGMLYTAIMRDITHRRANQEHVQNLYEVVKSRVQALEAFQYSVCHDLNAPLRSLEGFTEILMEDYSYRLDIKGKDYLRRILEATKRMRQLVNDMQKLSRITQAELELKSTDVSITEIAKDVISHLKDISPERCVNVVIQENMTVKGDTDLLYVALNNLIGNAWKFTSKNDRAKIIFSSRVEDDNIIYYIEDNGVGFDMAQYHKLFKPFQRLHDSKDFEGNGVGLAIVKRIIDLHKGSVWAEGVVGKGATFYFTIGKKNA